MTSIIDNTTEQMSKLGINIQLDLHRLAVCTLLKEGLAPQQINSYSSRTVRQNTVYYNLSLSVWPDCFTPQQIVARLYFACEAFCMHVP